MTDDYLNQEGIATVLPGADSYVLRGLYNADFTVLPPDPSLDIANDTNPLPFWTQTRVGTAVTARNQATFGNAALRDLYLSMVSGAAGDELAFEQIRRVAGNPYSPVVLPVVQFHDPTSSSGGQQQVFISYEFLDSASGSLGTATEANSTILALVTSGNTRLAPVLTFAPYNARYVRVRFGLRRSTAPTTGAAAIYFTDVSMLSGPSRILFSQEPGAPAVGDIRNASSGLVSSLPWSQVDVKEVATPATPAAGSLTVYALTDHKVYRKDSTGAVAELGGGGGTQVSNPSAVSLAADYLARVKLTADAAYRLRVGLDASDRGVIEFGDGTAAADLTMYRSSAGRARFAGSAAGINGVRVDGTAANHVQIEVSHAGIAGTTPVVLALDTLGAGYVALGNDGSGTGVRDVRLKRTAAAVAEFDNNAGAAATLNVVGTVKQNGIAAMPVGWMPYAYPSGLGPSSVTATALTLAAVGGTVVVPILVLGPGRLHGYQLWSTDIATARGPIDLRLWRDDPNSASALAEVVGSGAQIAVFTPTVAAVRSVALASPVDLPPGLYYLSMRNGHATSTLGVGCAPAGTMAANAAQTNTLATVPTGTLDMVTGWTKTTLTPGTRLNLRAFGQTSAF